MTTAANLVPPIPALMEKNQQMLQNISQLQAQEQRLHEQLQRADDPSQRNALLAQINETSQIRLSLYRTIKDMYAYYQKNTEAAATSVGQTVAAMDLVERELREAQAQVNQLADQQIEKRRLAEINTYYGKQYYSYTQMCKTIAFCFAPLIALALVYRTGLIPSSLYAFLTGLGLVIAGLLVGIHVLDISNRDAMNWDEYNWYFQKGSAPAFNAEAARDAQAAAGNPWLRGAANSVGWCVDGDCCAANTRFDPRLRQCVVDDDKTEQY